MKGPLEATVMEGFPDERVVLYEGPLSKLEENLGRRIRILYIVGCPIVIEMDWLQPDYDPTKEEFTSCCCCYYEDKDRHLIYDPCDEEITDRGALYHYMVCGCFAGLGGLLIGLPLWYLCCVDHKGANDPIVQYGPYKQAPVPVAMPVRGEDKDGY